MDTSYATAKTDLDALAHIRAFAIQHDHLADIAALSADMQRDLLAGVENVIDVARLAIGEDGGHRFASSPTDPQGNMVVIRDDRKLGIRRTGDADPDNRFDLLITQEDGFFLAKDPTRVNTAGDLYTEASVWAQAA